VSIVPLAEADMISQSDRPSTTIRDLAARPAARAGAVLIVLWLGTAILLRGEMSEFGPMIAILACASIVLWGPGGGRGFMAGQLVMWTALVAATALLLWESARLPGMLVLFGGAAAWFVLVEPILRTRRTS
jgi:hypothetical protein